MLDQDSFVNDFSAIPSDVINAKPKQITRQQIVTKLLEITKLKRVDTAFAQRDDFKNEKKLLLVMKKLCPTTSGPTSLKTRKTTCRC